MKPASTINTDFDGNKKEYTEFMRRMNLLPIANAENIKPGDILIYSFFKDYHTFCRRTLKKNFFFKVLPKKLFQADPRYKQHASVEENYPDVELCVNMTTLDSFRPFEYTTFSFYSSGVFRIIPKRDFPFFSQYATNPEVFAQTSSFQRPIPSIFL